MQSGFSSKLNKYRVLLIFLITIFSLSLVFSLGIVLAADPIAFDDDYDTDEDTALIISAPGVLANDTHTTTLTAVLDTGPLTGTLVLSPTGSFTYTPAIDFNGIVTFSYFATDAVSNSLPAMVFITVTAVNDPPIAIDDTSSTDEDSVLTVPAPGVLSNDTDPDIGDTKIVTSADTTTPNGATVSIDSDGSYTYTPTASIAINALAAGETIVDSFIYTMSDGSGITDTAVVSVTVNGINDLPLAFDDVAATDEDSLFSEISPGLLANDTDPDTNDTISVESFDPFSVNGAIVSVESDGGYSYIPTSTLTLQALDEGDLLIDTFTYIITDGNGGSDTAVASITITGVNDAPVLDNSGNMSLDDINEDVSNPSGDLVVSIVSSAFGNRITDDDASAIEGIAAIGVDDTNGTWEFTLDNGSNWDSFGTISETAAVLLDADGGSTRIRFIPNPNYNGPAGNITFRAWDQTTGSNGDDEMDVTNFGGATAFSTNTETATLTVLSVNDAPVLDNTGLLTLTNILEDASDPVGDTVNNIILSDGGDRITDVDTGALEGIAVIGADNSNGIWQYRTNGLWRNFGLVSNSSAILLDLNAFVRFLPEIDYFGPAGNITFRAWDQTSGHSGLTGVNVSTNGGTTPYSLITETATLTVTAINDEPVLDLNGNSSGTGFSATFAEDGGAVSIVDTDLSLIDVDHNNLISATAKLLNPQDGVSELLAVIDNNPEISTYYDSISGVLTLSGTDTVENYETILRTLAYTNTSQNPSTILRLVEIIVSDGLANSNTAVSEISVISINDNPILEKSEGLNVNEGLGNTIGVSVLEVTDEDNPPNEITFTLTQVPINGVLELFTTILNLNDTFTQEDINNSQLNYVHDGSETTSDSFNYTVSDGAGGTIGTTTFPIVVDGENDAPVLAFNTGLNVDEGGSGIISNSKLLVTDTDNTSDELTYFLEITPTYGLINRDGTSLVQNDTFTQEEIDNNLISYSHDGSENHLDNFTFRVNDPSGGPILSTLFTITINAINDLPVVDLNGMVPGVNYSATFTEDSGGVDVVDADMTIFDVDDTHLVSGQALLLNNLDGTAETLSVTTSGTNITGNYNASTGVLTLSGSDSIAHYQDVFRSLRYNNTSQNPNTSTRTVTIVVDDGLDESVVTSSSIDIIAMNDSPALATNTELTLAYGHLKVITSNYLRYSDPDNTVDELIYTVLDTPDHGQLKLNGTDLVANDTFSQADINSNRLAYEHDKSNTESDSFDFSVDDSNGGTSDTESFNIIIWPQPKVYLPIVLNNYIYGEPNDSACAAFGIGLNHDYKFLPDDVEDWYEFSLDTTGNVTVEISNYYPSDGQLLVYKGNSCQSQNLQQIGHNPSITPSGLIVLNLQLPGTYYVRVFTAVIPSNPSVYTLQIKSP